MCGFNAFARAKWRASERSRTFIERRGTTRRKPESVGRVLEFLIEFDDVDARRLREDSCTVFSARLESEGRMSRPSACKVRPCRSAAEIQRRSAALRGTISRLSYSNTEVSWQPTLNGVRTVAIRRATLIERYCVRAVNERLFSFSSVVLLFISFNIRISLFDRRT